MEKSNDIAALFDFLNDGPDPEAKKKFDEYKRLADQGDADALIKLGNCYKEESGIFTHATQAVICYYKAAVLGNPEAQFLLGLCALRGCGIPYNDKAATVCYRKAAEQGHLEAQYNLGCRFLPFYPEFTLEADEIEFEDPQRGFSLTRCPTIDYLEEYKEKCREELKESAKWLEKAAEQGLAKAQYRLGRYYMLGIGIPQNYEKAVELFKKAADQGETRGLYCLGQCYEKGFGVPQSWEEAIKCYTEAADKSNPDAAFRMGELYEYGEGVPKNERKSHKWYCMAEGLGHGDAMDKIYGNECGDSYDVQDYKRSNFHQSYSFTKSLWEK